MGKRQLLFVTYRDQNIDEGGAYAIELAKAMYEDITILLVQKKGNLSDRMGNMMSAASFAEAGEYDTAREILHEEPMRENFRVNAMEKAMTAATFAEAGEMESAREIMAQSTQDLRRSFEEKLAVLRSSCEREGITVRVEDSKLDAARGIKTFLRTHTGIDKVVLSPAVTSDGYLTAKELNDLVRTASRPIVTMTRQACCAV